MGEAQYKASIDRTEAKLRFSLIYLNELKQIERRGDDIERAHQESFLFHLYGVRDAFLQELNIKFDCDLPIDKVNKHSLRKKMEGMEAESEALTKFSDIESDKNGWLYCLCEMRNHSIHRNSIPRLFHVGGESDGEVHLTNTKSGDFFAEDYVDTFEQWHEEMSVLMTALRNIY